MPEGVFIDKDNDVLKYRAEYWKNGEKQIIFPKWLSFDSERVRLSGTPSKNDI